LPTAHIAKWCNLAKSVLRVLFKLVLNITMGQHTMHMKQLVVITLSEYHLRN
jgi:hypothetical protein